MYAAAWSRERRSGRSPGRWGAGPLLGSARGLLFIPATPSGLVGASTPAGPHLLGLIENTTPPSVDTPNLARTEFLSSARAEKHVSILCLQSLSSSSVLWAVDAPQARGLRKSRWLFLAGVWAGCGKARRRRMDLRAPAGRGFPQPVHAPGSPFCCPQHLRGPQRTNDVPERTSCTHALHAYGPADDGHGTVWTAIWFDSREPAANDVSGGSST
jgi:hypothetical protein